MLVHDHITGVTGAEIRSFGFHVLGAAPSTGNFAGRFYWDSALLAPRWWDGAAWTNKATDSALLGGQTLAQVLARSAHTGTQTASTISDFDTQVRTSRLDQMAAPTAAVSMGSQKIINGAAATNPNDFVIFSQMEAIRQGTIAKSAVDSAMTTNVTISNPGTATFDGQVLAAGEAILLMGQTTGTENGIYVFNGTASAMTRRDDADVFSELDAGTEVFVQGNGANKGKWRQQTELTGFGGQSWVLIGSGTTYVAGSGLTESPAGTFNVGAGAGISVTADAVAIDTAVVNRKGSATLTTSATSYTVPHGLGSADLNSVVVRNTATGELEYPRTVVDATNIVITFLVAPAANAYRVSWSG